MKIKFINMVLLAIVFSAIILACGDDYVNVGDDSGSGTIPNPDPPAGLVAIANSTSSINIGWGAVSGADGYYIYRSEISTDVYTQVGTSKITSYADTDLSAGTTYYYRIATYNSDGTGSQSSYVSATTRPNAPTGLETTANSTSSITVSWASESGATGYYIYRSTSANGTYTRAGSSTTASYTDNNLSSGTTYYYKVTAYNGGGESAESSYVSATTQPNAPTGVTATANSTNSITISWANVAGATEYYIYYSESASGTYTHIGTSTTTTYTDNSLSSGTTYYYKIASYNSGGEGSQSSSVSATTQPSAPTGVTATANSTSSITIDWTAVSGATGYYIYRSTDASAYTRVGTSTTTSYANTGLSASTLYYYYVVAYNSSGESTESNTVFAVTQ